MARIRVTRFRPDIRTRTHSQRGDDVFAFVPFCCQQQVSGTSRVGFAEESPERVFILRRPVLELYLTTSGAA
jgi:hypothetical protein